MLGDEDVRDSAAVSRQAGDSSSRSRGNL